MSKEQHPEDSGNGGSGKSRRSAESASAKQQPMRQTAVLALAALVVAGIAAAGMILIWLDRPQIDADTLVSADDMAQLRADQNEQFRRLDGLDSTAESLEQAVESIQSAMADLRQALREQGSDGEALARRVADLESGLVAAVERIEAFDGVQREVDRDLARRLNLMEAAALLRIGQERVEMADDMAGAREAYRRAYRLLRELDDARVNRARGQVAQELEALETVVGPDWSALTARLSRAAAAVSEWPMIANGADVDSGPEIGDPEPGWRARIGSTLAGLIRVRARDAVVLTTEELDAVREQVRLRLAAAELALARRDLADAAHHADQVRDLIERRFDANDAGVARAKTVLSELIDTEATPVPALGVALMEINRLLEES